MAPPNPDQLTFFGVIIAGGRSVRMGMNKALLTLEGKPLWERQYLLLHEAGAEKRAVSLRPDHVWTPPEVACIFDDGTAGPLGGLVAALKSCEATHLLALAVDLPFLPVAWFQQLAALCRPSRGAIGWREDLDAFEPLAAIYPRELLSEAEGALTRKEFSLQKLAQTAATNGRLARVVISPEQIPWFANWNSPADVVSS